MSRIIAGSAKGRRLRTPAHSETRPTTDRVREAVFSLIAGWAGTAGAPAEQQLAGLSFLDLYAGTGAIGLEAASRGAAPVWAVEHNAATARIVRANVDVTGLSMKVVAASVERTLAEAPPHRFDVVWADPPYSLDAAHLSRMLRALNQGWLAGDGLVLVERSTRDPAPVWPDELRDVWDRRYGETTLYFARGKRK